MANPTIKAGVPQQANLLAALWISDQIDQAGTPTKGAWDAVSQTFWPVFGPGTPGDNFTPVVCGTSGRNGLRNAAVNCGIALASTIDHTGTVYDMTGSQVTIVALWRPLNSNTSGTIFQNRRAWSPYQGLGVGFADGYANGDVFATVGGGQSPSANGVVVANQMMVHALTWDGTTQRIWKNGSASGIAISTSGTMTSANGDRRAGLFNYSQSRGFASTPLELYGLLLYSVALTQSELQQFGTTEAELLAGSFHSKAFSFGEPVITIQPSSQSVTAPATATFSVTASGSGLSYQWQSQPSGGGGYADIGGATLASYTTGATSATGGSHSNGTTYRCVVTNSSGSITSNAAVLNVAAAADTTAPTMSGALTASAITQTSYTLSWSAGSDNVGVTAYERSLDGGTTWVNVGSVLTVNITGRTAGTTDQCRVRCKDAAGNTSTAISASVALLAASDTTPPTLTGTLTISALQPTSYTVTGPAATDNVGVTAYEYSLDGGTSWTGNGTSLTFNVTGRTSGNVDPVRWRAVDAAGNRSAALSASVTLPTTSVVTDIMSNGSGSVLADTVVSWTVVRNGTIGSVQGSTVIDGIGTTNAQGRLTLTGLAPGAIDLWVKDAPGRVFYQQLTVA